MFWLLSILFWTLKILRTVSAYNYDPAWTSYNLNTNRFAQHPLEYSGEWEGHEYTPSPKNWRMPFYSLFIDRFVNGDPTNDNINGTLFEHDLSSTQMRSGGDLQGLIDSLDYLQGMGIKVDHTISWMTCTNVPRDSILPARRFSTNLGPMTRTPPLI